MNKICNPVMEQCNDYVKSLQRELNAKADDDLFDSCKTIEKLLSLHRSHKGSKASPVIDRSLRHVLLMLHDTMRSHMYTYDEVRPETVLSAVKDDVLQPDEIALPVDMFAVIFREEIRAYTSARHVATSSFIDIPTVIAEPELNEDLIQELVKGYLATNEKAGITLTVEVKLMNQETYTTLNVVRVDMVFRSAAKIHRSHFSEIRDVGIIDLIIHP